MLVCSLVPLFLTLVSLTSQANAIPALGFANNHASRPDPLVKTKSQGTFRGIYNATSQVEVFYGVPFAEPPLRELRFQKPVPAKPYTGKDIRDATKPKDGCLQLETISFAGPVGSTSEDCLYLQVHRPEGTKEGDDLPVMIWIFGGGWVAGTTGLYNTPETFVQRSAQLGQKIIHVAGEYRLGPFGFLAGSDIEKGSKNGTATPNAGHYDQREVMHWVQNNIQSFGGDAKRVTIFGESAGAQSVGAHLIANGGDTEGLFRGAILQSGAAGTSAHYNVSDPTPQGIYDELRTALKCDNLACLRTVSAEDLRAASAKIDAGYAAYGAPGFFPVIDGYIIPDVPSKLYAEGKLANVPIIAGDNLDEGTLFAAWAQKVTTEEKLTEGLLVTQGNYTRDLTPDLLKLWPNEDTVGSPFRPELFGVAPNDRYFGAKSDFKRAAGIEGDFFFVAPVRSLLHATKDLNRKSWAYLFAQPSPQAYSNLTHWLGINHSSDVAYVYNNPAPAPVQPANAAEAEYCNAATIKQTADFMSAAWINFAHHLDPNGREGTSDHHARPVWPSYSASAKTSKDDVGKAMYIQGGNLTTIDGDYRKEQVGFFLEHKDVYVL